MKPHFKWFIEVGKYLDDLDAPKTQPCSICGQEGRFRYAPYDFGSNRAEADRWRCTQHRPRDATYEGWNGEWDDYFPEEM